MVCMEVQGLSEKARGHLMAELRARAVDSRPYFYPVSDMPMFERANTPVVHQVYSTGINLPSYYDMTQDDVEYVCKQVQSTLSSMGLL